MNREDVIYKGILANMSDGVMTIDLNGMIITFNSAAAAILGLKKSETLGKPFAEVFMMREGSDAFNQIILDAIYESAVIHNKAADFLTDRGQRTLEVTTSFLHIVPEVGVSEGEEGAGDTAAADAEEAGEKLAVIAVFKDVTEINELRVAEQKLTEELKENHKMLQDAYLEIEGTNLGLQAALKKVQMTRIAAAIFVVLMVVGIGGFSWMSKRSVRGGAASQSQQASSSGDPSQVQTIVVTSQPVKFSILLTGKLNPLNVIHIVSPFDGKVAERYFEYGQDVTKGQVLLKMNTSKVTVRLRDAEVAFIKASDELSELENWEQSSRMSEAKRALTRAQMNLDTQKKTLADVKMLFEKGIVPESEYESTRQQLTNVKMDFAASEENLDATRQLGSKKHLKVSRLQLENTRYQLTELRDQMQKAVVTAPVSGTVIKPSASDLGDGPKNIEKGTSISQGALLVSIGDTQGFSVGASVDEEDVTKIKAGQLVNITGGAFPDATLSGQVAHVSSQATAKSRGNPSYDIIVRTGPIEKKIRENILLGMSATLDLISYNNPEALLVPIDAVRQGAEGRYIVLMDKASGKTRDVPVITGVTTLDSVEILNGLSPGDEVVLSY